MHKALAKRTAMKVGIFCSVIKLLSNGQNGFSGNLNGFTACSFFDIMLFRLETKTDGY